MHHAAPDAPRRPKCAKPAQMRQAAPNAPSRPKCAKPAQMRQAAPNAPSRPECATPPRMRPGVSLVVTGRRASIPIACGAQTFDGVPWRYLSLPELRQFLIARVRDGFTFPLNPKWILCDPGFFE